MPRISFIVQGLSKWHVGRMIASTGLTPAQCQIRRLSPFRAIWRIGMQVTDLEEKTDKNASGEKPEKKPDIYFDTNILEAPLRLIQAAAEAGEFGLVILVSVLAYLIITGSFFLWIFISIPLLLLGLSALTLGDAWKMLRIYRIDLQDPAADDTQKMIDYIILQGALSSRNVLELVPAPRSRTWMNRLIENQKAFVRCVAITSYSVFFLGLILLVEEFFINLSGGIITMTWLVLGIPAVLAFSLSTYYLFTRKNLIAEYVSGG